MFNLLYKSFGTIFVYICVRGKTYEHPKNVWHLNLSVFITNLLEMQKKILRWKNFECIIFLPYVNRDSVLLRAEANTPIYP